MTLWNPRSIFSNSERSDVVEPTAAFDPSRTGDPLPRRDGPSIGLGSTQPDGPADVTAPRNPIGFAPPAHERPAPRYSTEFSFRRHHDVPRASAAPEPPLGDAPGPWVTPGVEVGSADSDSEPGSADVVHEDEEAKQEERVSILKREIGFGRKRSQTAEDAPAQVTDAPVENEVAAQAQAEEPAQPGESAEGSGEEAASPAVVPFYKREINLRRRREAREAVAVVAAGDAVEEPVEAEQEFDVPIAVAAAEAVPFYKREISFGRKKHAPEETVAEGDAPLEQHEDEEAPADEPEPAEVVAEAEPEADAPTEAQAEEPEAPADVAAEPVAEAVPFYRREISFRRKTTAAVEPEGSPEIAAEAEEATSPEHNPEPVVAGAVAAAAVAAAATADDGEDEKASEIAPAVEEVAGPASEAVADEPTADEVVASEEEPEHVVAAEPEPEVEEVADDTPAATLEQSGAVGGPAEAAAEGADDVVEAPAADSSELGSEPADERGAEVEDSATDRAEPSEVDEAPSAAGRFSRRKGAPKKDRGRSTRGHKGRRVVGLKIGASQIAAAVINETEAGHELVQLARRPLAAGIVVDGEVRDAAALTSALKSFFEDENLPRRDIRVGVSSNRIGVRTFDIATVEDEKQFDNAVRFKAHELLPVAVHESVLDYRVLEEKPNGEGELMRRVLLVVAPRDQVEPYLQVANNAGLKLAGIDLEALALLRTFVAPIPTSAGVVADTATVVVAVGHETSTLLVAAGGACEFTRVFDWGGGDLVDSIAASLEVDRSEAATILQHLSLTGPGRKLETLDDESRTRAVEAVRLRLTPFARELVNSLQFYQTQPDSLGIGGIVVTGGTSHLEGLDSSLNQMIGVSVATGDPFGRVIRTDVIDPALESAIGSLAVPIGLAIDEPAMRGVNLIPTDASQSARDVKATARKVALPVAVAVPLIALGALYFGAHGSASSSRNELNAVNAEIASLPKAVKPRIQANVAAEEAARATALASVLGSRVAWDAVFSDLARVLPENVWLQSLAVTDPASTGAPGSPAAAAAGAARASTTGQPATAPSAVNIDGFTYDQTDVARLLGRLATLPTLDRVTLVSSDRTVVGTRDAVHFVIVADLKTAGGAS